MPYSINPIHTFLVLCTIFFSCQAQNQSDPKTDPPKALQNSYSFGTPVSEMDKAIMVIFQDADSNYWFGGRDKGLYQYNPTSQQLLHFTEKEGLAGNGILSIQEDKMGRIYFETGGGISQFDGKSFRTLSLENVPEYSLAWTLDPDDLWFKGKWDENGPYQYISSQDKLYHLPFPKHPLEDQFYADAHNVAFSPYGIYFIYTDQKGHVWFGTSNLGVCRYDGRSHSWISEREVTELEPGPAPGVRGIIEDRAGHFWFSNDLQHRYRIWEKTTSDPIHGMDYEALPGIDISKAEGLRPFSMSLAEDKKGRIWIATYTNGVWCYDPAATESQLRHYPLKEGNRTIEIFAIYTDKLENLWLATHNGGAFRLNGETFEPFLPEIQKE